MHFLILQKDFHIYFFLIQDLKVIIQNMIILMNIHHYNDVYHFILKLIILDVNI